MRQSFESSSWLYFVVDHVSAVHVFADHVTADHVTADHVTAGHVIAILIELVVAPPRLGVLLVAGPLFVVHQLIAAAPHPGFDGG